jgi:hypothetical protein
MAVVYPGLVNIDGSTITVNTVNVYDDNQRTHTYDLTDQFPDWVDNPELEGQALIDFQTPLSVITLPHPARINTLMIILDGLTLSPQLHPDGPGDYRVINSTTVEMLWGPTEESPVDENPRRHSATDTPVLLARYTLA